MARTKTYTVGDKRIVNLKSATIEIALGDLITVRQALRRAETPWRGERLADEIQAVLEAEGYGR